MQQEVQFASLMEYGNGPIRLNVVNDIQVDIGVQRDMSFVTCSLSHKTMFELVIQKRIKMH